MASPKRCPDTKHEFFRSLLRPSNVKTFNLERREVSFLRQLAMNRLHVTQWRVLIAQRSPLSRNRRLLAVAAAMGGLFSRYAEESHHLLQLLGLCRQLF